MNIKVLNLKVVKEKEVKYEVETEIANSPKVCRDIIESIFHLSELSEENLVMLTLDTKNKVTGAYLVSTGSLNSSIVHPREVFKRALMSNASSIIIAHNHPSGDIEPSREDISITKRLNECSKILGIHLLDHIIIGDSYLSFKEKGYL